MKPMHIVSFAPGLLIYQALVSSALRELLGQRETNPSFTTTKSVGASGCLHIHLASTLFAASSKLRVIGNAPMSLGSGSPGSFSVTEFLITFPDGASA
jgi:hypothetical protein